MKHIGRGFLFTIAVLCAPAVAEAVEPVEQHNSNAVWFENWTGLSNATLTVVAPDGAVASVFAASGSPVYKLPAGDVPDGRYFYEMTAATGEQVRIVNQIDSGRGAASRGTAAKPFYLQGGFTVARGVIIAPEEIKESDG